MLGSLSIRLAISATSILTCSLVLLFTPSLNFIISGLLATSIVISKANSDPIISAKASFLVPFVEPATFLPLKKSNQSDCE